MQMSCNSSMIQKNHINKALTSFFADMGDSLPSWFQAYLQNHLHLCREGKPESVTQFETHSFTLIEAHLHALYLSGAYMLLSHYLSIETGHVLIHLCGCADCFIPGKVVLQVTHEFKVVLRHNYLSHLKEEKKLRKVA